MSSNKEEDEYRWSLNASEEIQENLRAGSLPADELYLPSDEEGASTDDDFESDDDFDADSGIQGKSPTKKKKKTKKLKKKKKVDGSVATKNSGSSSKRSKSPTSSSRRSKSPTRRRSKSPTKPKAKKDKKKKKKKLSSPQTDADSISDDSLLEESPEAVLSDVSGGDNDDTVSSAEAADKYEASLPPNNGRNYPNNTKCKPTIERRRLSDHLKLGAKSSLLQEFGSGVYSRTSEDRDRAFSEAFDSEYGVDPIQRCSVQNMRTIENLLNELQQCESQLEEERSEMANERTTMQLKNESLEQILQREMDKNSRLKSQVLDLEERLEQTHKAKGDDALLQKLEALEAQNQLLRDRTERQRQSIAAMAVDAKRNENSHRDRRGSMSEVQKLPAKEQGELLMLRHAFERQAQELAKKEEQLRSTKDYQRVQELEQAVETSNQQIIFFMNEIERLKKLLEDKRSPKSDKKFSWFGSNHERDTEKSLLDIAEKKRVYGSPSDDESSVEEDDIPVPELKNASSSGWWSIGG